MRINRRGFLAGMTAFLGERCAAQDSPRNWLLIPADQLARMRAAATGARAAQLEKLASSALRSGPWSVTASRPTGFKAEAGEHDYFSEGPYWWPDPENPNGPYLRKDGHRNPARFKANHDDLGAMCGAVLALGMGTAFLRKDGCAEHAGGVLSAWFLDPKTRMNPNLEFGQAIRGINSGRGTGLIDTVSFIQAIQGTMLLESAAGLDAKVSAGMREWFHEFSAWMTTSKKGLDEKNSGNNHMTWWTAQVAAYATFTGDSAMQRMAWDYYRQALVPKEIAVDGSCAKEESRTISLSYSSMNLDAFAVICRLGQAEGEDLWHYRAPNGASVRRACEYLLPYALDPAAWKHEQIDQYSASGHFFAGLAGVGIPSTDLLAGYRKLPHAENAWIQFLDLAVETSRMKE